MLTLGFDTSNYTTSVAAFDGVGGKNCSRLLDVKPGELGLRQSDALFAHIKRLPELVDALCASVNIGNVTAIGVSTRPRAVEGSYMPCFLAGSSTAEVMSRSLNVPFFAFSNNNIGTNDLKNIKPLIDTYCKVFSGFVNDLEDIQEIIFVLTNYGGADLNEFLRDMKNYKTIKIDNDSGDDKSGVSTLTIEIPVEAREKMMEVSRKCIFEQGMGIDPDPQNFGNSSGVALNFLYSLLELKAGLMETEFRPSFGRFIRCICRLLGVSVKEDTITQTWTRTSVRNEQELAQIASQSKGVISDETIVRNHPWVENPEKELEQLQEQEEEQMQKAEGDQAFSKKNVGGNDGKQQGILAEKDAGS